MFFWKNTTKKIFLGNFSLKQIFQDLTFFFIFKFFILRLFFALMSLKVSFFLVKKTTKKWISWGEKCKFLDFLKKKKKSEKKHFFLVSAHKRDFFQKTQKMTFSVQQIDKKWFKKKVSKGSSTWFFFQKWPFLNECLC